MTCDVSKYSKRRLKPPKAQCKPRFIAWCCDLSVPYYHVFTSKITFVDSGKDVMNEDLDGAKQAKDMSNLRAMLKEIVEDELEEMDEDL